MNLMASDGFVGFQSDSVPKAVAAAAEAAPKASGFFGVSAQASSAQDDVRRKLDTLDKVMAVVVSMVVVVVVVVVMMMTMMMMMMMLMMRRPRRACACEYD